jgi:hypothetical protein
MEIRFSPRMLVSAGCCEVHFWGGIICIRYFFILRHHLVIVIMPLYLHGERVNIRRTITFGGSQVGFLKICL